MSTIVKNFMGIPVEMDSLDQGRRASVEQWDVEALEKLVKPLLEAGVSIRWDQYTPYFNDGDVCEFDVGDPGFLPVEFSEMGEDEYEDRYDGYLEFYNVKIEGGEETRYEVERSTSWPYGSSYKSIPTGRTFERHPAYLHMEALRTAMNAGHFEELLYDRFGDHAQITITPEKITKEFYDHD